MTPIRPAGRALSLALPALCVIVASLPAAAFAQEEQRRTAIRNLPRPGLEAPALHVGSAVLQLQLEGGALYDSNVYATSTDAKDDISFRLKPAADITLTKATMDLSADLWADVLRHAQITGENNAQFGGGLDLVLRPMDGHKLTANAHFDRLTQSRADPEARAPTFAHPRKMNDYGGQLGYAIQGANLGVSVSAEARGVSFLDPAERDRNHRSIQATGRLSWLPHGATALFVEGFVLHRDFKLPVDFSGENRDATTYGVNLGVSRELSSLLTGSLGVGYFRFNPAASSLKGYSGFGFGGWVTWTPRPRTSITANLFRGDVATVRSGATGRTDTRLSLHIDQEVRHNLLVGATIGWTRNEYRGAPDQKRQTLSGSVSGEYLLGPRLSVFTEATFAKRTARQPTDKFDRAQIQFGLRLRF